MSHSGKRRKLPGSGEATVRANVLRLIAIDGRSKASIAKAAGIDPSRFNRFTLGTGGITVEEVFLLREALDVPMSQIVKLAATEPQATHAVPVIFLRDVYLADPPPAPTKSDLTEMINFRHRWEDTHRSDPRIYAVDIQEAFADVLPGDVAFFSDSSKPAPRDMMVVLVNGKACLATCVQVNGQCAASLPGGDIATEYRYMGRRVELVRR